MHERIRVLKGSSTDPRLSELKTIAKRHERVMVVLDSCTRTNTCWPNSTLRRW